MILFSIYFWKKIEIYGDKGKKIHQFHFPELVLNVPEPIYIPGTVPVSQITFYDPYISGHSGLRLEYVNVNLTSLSVSFLPSSHHSSHSSHSSTHCTSSSSSHIFTLFTHHYMDTLNLSGFTLFRGSTVSPVSVRWCRCLGRSYPTHAYRRVLHTHNDTDYFVQMYSSK